MNKRKINNCGIQTSKRPDADIGKDEVMGRDAAIGTWNVDTDMGKEDKDRTIGDDNSGTTIPLGAFPKKIQEMAKVLVEYENYNQDYLLVSMLSAAATAIGNTCQIRIKGCWTSSPILYVILVGRPGVGKTPPLDFAFKPISVPLFSASRIIFPVEIAGMDKCWQMTSAWVPLPAPGAPRRIRFISFPPYQSRKPL